MEETERISQVTTAADHKPKSPDHICILVHGLWGNPAHLNSLSTSLAEKHPDLHILVAKRNSDSYTYDGIEVGGERVAQEIEDELKELEQNGHKITKMSFVGYSLGGLIARYTIGLLFKKGIFDRIQPVNFNAFASPFLGVRAPLRGYHSSLWNALGGRTLSTSGRQLFLIDSFRDTGRPLISVLADKGSIFMEGLKLFKHKVLYANIINDRSAPWYTTGISRSDPFEDLSTVKMNFVKGYESVILEPDNPVRLKEVEQLPLTTRYWNYGSSVAGNLPLYGLMAVLAPIGTAAFLVNSGIQTVRSNQRLRLHNEGQASGAFLPYQIPIMMEKAVEAMSGSVPEEHLASADTETEADSSSDEAEKADAKRCGAETDMYGVAKRPKRLFRTRSRPEFPVLALADEQFEMIDALNEVGFRKYPVWISRVRHTHAAIIVRLKREAFSEGRTVIKHWLNEEFEL